MAHAKDIASIKDVAIRADVSVMTVSRAINDPKKLKPDTLKKVQQAIEELGYVPDYSARKVRNGNKTKTIGVLAFDTATSPFSVELNLSIEETARAHGWGCFVINMFKDNNPDYMVDMLLSYRPEGIIVSSMGLKFVKLPKKLLDYRCVFANCECIEKNFACYEPDDEQGQYKIVKELLKAGYRKPLCLHLPTLLIATPRRRYGLERACREFGIDPNQLIHYHMEVGDEHYRDMPSLVLNHIKNGKPQFDSVICGNDRIAFMVYQTLLTEGFKIPQDIGVIGYDNLVGIGDLFMPALSTVQIPHYEIGRLSTLHIINNLENNNKVMVDSPCLIRSSFRKIEQ